VAANCSSERKPAPPLPPASHNPRSHNSLKRSDPFQFGSRYLLADDDVYEFNAWDHVETDETYKEYVEAQLAKQRQAPVTEFDKSMCWGVYVHPLAHPHPHPFFFTIFSLLSLTRESLLRLTSSSFFLPISPGYETAWGSYCGHRFCDYYGFFF
jgi:hypothetical protein